MNQKALKFKFAFFALLLILLMPECKAQNEKISWGDPITMDRYWIANILNDNAGNVYALSIEKNAINVKQLDGEQLKLLFEFDILLKDAEGNKLNYVQRFMHQDAIYLIADFKQKKARNRVLKIQKISLQGEILEPWRELFQVGPEFKNEEIKIEFLPELGKLIISGEAINEVTQETTGQRYIIFGADSKIEKDYIIHLKDDRFKFSVYRWLIDKNGFMYILGYAMPVLENSELGSRALIVKSDLDGVVQEEWEIPLGKRSIVMSSSEIEIDSLGNITLAGLYQDYHDTKREKPANAGILYLRFASGLSMPIYQNAEELSESLLKSIPKSEKWKAAGMEYFNFVHYYRLQAMGSGKFIVVFEQMGKKPPYPYYDIFILGVNETGKISWQRTIQRNARDNNNGEHTQTALYKSKNGVKLFFIDHRDNYDANGNRIETEKPEWPNTVNDPIMMLGIDLEGNLTYTQIGEMIKGKIRVRIGDCRFIDSNTIFFYANSYGRTYLPGILKIN